MRDNVKLSMFLSYMGIFHVYVYANFFPCFHSNAGENLHDIFSVGQDSVILSILYKKLNQKSCKWCKAPKIYQYYA